MTISERSELKPQITDAISKVCGNTGIWADFAQVGIQLSNRGINYKDYSYDKLGNFLNEFGDAFDFCSKNPASGGPPVRYVRVKEENKHITSTSRSKNSSKQKIGIIKPIEDMELNKWAYIPYPKNEKLANMAQKEDWSFRGKNLGGLWFYLNNTFKRLVTENKVLFSDDGKYAAFNTGLVDDYYEYIYALFENNKSSGALTHWRLKDFVIPGVDIGKILTSNFRVLSEKADYFNYEFRNVVFDTLKEITPDLHHIILERTYRLPLEFFNMLCPPGFLDIDGENANDVYALSSKDSRKYNYFNKLGEKIKADQNVMQKFNEHIKNAIDLAKKRVECNYSIATPMYDFRNHRCAMLLPLALVDYSHIDLALVVTLEPSGIYQGQTILPLDIAYFDSRLIAKPNIGWLKPSAIINDNNTTNITLNEATNVKVESESNIKETQDTKISELINNFNKKPTSEDIANVDRLIANASDIITLDSPNYLLEYYTQINQVNNFDDYFSTRNITKYHDNVI